MQAKQNKEFILLFPIGRQVFSQVSCPSCIPSQFLVHPQPTHWQGIVRNRKPFDVVCILFSNS